MADETRGPLLDRRRTAPRRPAPTSSIVPGSGTTDGSFTVIEERWGQVLQSGIRKAMSALNVETVYGLIFQHQRRSVN
jgi:hypothetical protein